MNKFLYIHFFVNLYSLIPVPDLHIEGSLSAIHVMLDKPQLDLVKGLINMNLGEGIEDFEKPSTVIRDPIAPVRVEGGGGEGGRERGRVGGWVGIPIAHSVYIIILKEESKCLEGFEPTISSLLGWHSTH